LNLPKTFQSVKFT